MAPLFALENLDDALDATTSFLRPVDRTMWLKLAVVAFFIGGPGANANSFQWTFGGGGGNGGGTPTNGFVDPGIGGAEWLVIAAIIGTIITIALLFGIVGSVMEFVFVESLRRRDVQIRQYWGERWRQGIRLFVFRFALGLFVLGSVLLLAVPFLAGVFDVATIGSGTAIAFFLVLLPVFVVLAFVVGLVNGFTTVFVVPIMLLENSGVLAGWRRLWPTITANPLQYVAYLVASFFLGIVGGVLVAIVAAVLALVLLIPFGVLFAIGGAILAFVSEAAGIAVLVVVGVAFALALVVGVALIQVPVQTYLRYYALLVLGDIDTDLDLIPDQRAEIREPSVEPGDEPAA